MPKQSGEATSSSEKAKKENPLPVQTQLQKYSITTMLRSQLTAAVYNPRQIDEGAKKKLRASLKRFGLVQPIVYNKRTGNIVAGHQRLEQMDSFERGKDYKLDVAEIDVDEKTEKELNVFLNNELAMGTFDLGKLEMLFKDSDLSIEACGFEEFELANMLPEFEPPMTPALEQATADAKRLVDGVDEVRKKGRELKKQIADDIARRDQQTKPEVLDSELFVVLCFPNREASDAFLELLKLPTTEKYISGEMVRERLSPTPTNENYETESAPLSDDMAR